MIAGMPSNLRPTTSECVHVVSAIDMTSGKLNAQNFRISHINDTLLKTMPDISQMLLQFVDIMNLANLLLHFSPSVSSLTQVTSGTNVCVWVFV